MIIQPVQMAKAIVSANDGSASAAIDEDFSQNDNRRDRRIDGREPAETDQHHDDDADCYENVV